MAVGDGHNGNIYNMIDIVTLAKEAPGTIIAVQAGDLMEATNRLIDQVRADLEKELTARATAKMLTKDTVMELLGVSSTTLWRWEKLGYLVPVMVGGQRRYKSWDIEQIMELGDEKGE